jgi:hypothetical protein
MHVLFIFAIMKAVLKTAEACQFGETVFHTGLIQSSGKIPSISSVFVKVSEIQISKRYIIHNANVRLLCKSTFLKNLIDFLLNLNSLAR